MTDSGVILIPVSIAESPSATDRYSGMTKNSPIITMNWKKNITSPPVIWRLREQRRADERLAARRLEAPDVQP